MITLLIARHGNTFDPGDTILRVGKQTDLPLSNSGREQAKRLGVFLQEKHPKIDRVFVSSLKRTQETASIALPNTSFSINPIFDEIDYGIDDGKPESEVIERIGEDALKQWEENAVPPQGWLVEPEKIIQAWKDFALNYVNAADVGANGLRPETTILVVTSNGIARFAPSIMSKVSNEYLTPSNLKMKTGAISCFQFTQERDWQLDYWNVSPV